MKISFETKENVNGLLTLTVEAADYTDKVEKSLKNYRKNSNVPGFRPGMVPMGIVKKQYGMAAKVNAVNEIVEENLFKYIKENNIPMLGSPMASEKNDKVDLEHDDDFVFSFDIAVAPEFNVELSNKDKITYYKVEADDKLIDKQIDSFASNMGGYEKAKTYKDNDMLKGTLCELDSDGKIKEGGLTVNDAVLMPLYIKVEDQKKLFDKAKLKDVITFNPRKAYPDNDAELTSLLKIKKEEVANYECDFTYEINEINRFKKHDLNQELFDAIYGKDVIKDEAGFRAKIKEGLEAQLSTETDFKFLADLKDYVMKKIGKLTYPDEILKRVMLEGNKDKENAKEYVDTNYDESIKALTWQLAENKLMKEYKVTVEQNDIKATAAQAAREQFAQYGMPNVPQEYVDNYVGEMLKKQDTVERLYSHASDAKLLQILKTVVKLDEKTISMDEYNKMLEKQDNKK